MSAPWPHSVPKMLTGFEQPEAQSSLRRSANRGEIMRVLALSSQKGGSGKTTLSGHLAVQAQLAGYGPVCRIDIDPQGSLADWWNERESEMPAFAQTTVARLGAQLERSEKRRVGKAGG